MMERNLDGKTPVVTGTSRGIGLAITRELVGEGAFVVAGALHPGDHELAGMEGTGLVEPVAVDRENSVGSSLTLLDLSRTLKGR